jgi:hypothetical protein
MANAYGNVTGLIFGCPYNLVQSDCPFLNIRKLTDDARVEYIDSLTNSELETLVGHHFSCSITHSQKLLKKL